MKKGRKVVFIIAHKIFKIRIYCMPKEERLIPWATLFTMKRNSDIYFIDLFIAIYK